MTEGDRVVYTDPGSGKRETGVVTSVTEQYVFVHYDDSLAPNGIATDPDRLEIHPGGAGAKL